MKKIWLLTFMLVLTHMTAWACTVCKEQQPNFLKDISHGAGPESNWDYTIVVFAIAVVAGTFVFSIRFLFKPGENDRSHVKHSILNPPLYE